MILQKIAEKTEMRYNAIMRDFPYEEVRSKALSLEKGNFEFEKALCGKDISFICEVKKASPSKGIIAEEFDYLSIAKDYEKAGADCISCLTEPYWFLGSDRYLEEISKNVSIPVLRKDFTINDYQIYEAKLLGAKAVLLICSILSEETIKSFIETADSLGMSSLVEAHDESEIKTALNAGARIIGVNNRNLKDFSVDINNSQRLRELVGNKAIFVSESGVKTKEDIQRLRDNKTDAVLIGETLMRSKDKTAALRELRGEKYV